MSAHCSANKGRIYHCVCVVLFRTVKEWKQVKNSRDSQEFLRAILKVDVFITTPAKEEMLLLNAIMAFEFVITPETNYPKHPGL